MAIDRRFALIKGLLTALKSIFKKIAKSNKNIVLLALDFYYTYIYIHYDLLNDAIRTLFYYTHIIDYTMRKNVYFKCSRFS